MTDIAAGSLTHQFKADLSDLRKGIEEIKAGMMALARRAIRQQPSYVKL